MLRDLAIPDFLDKLNSSEPTPGGGGCAALNGAIAAGLIQMVCNVTTNKMLKKEQPVDKELVKTVLVAKNYQDELLRLIDLDAEAFGIVINSYKLPKSTDVEKAARVLGISEACKKACKPPLDTLDICVKLLPLARTSIERGDKNVVSDGYVAGRILFACIWSAVYNVNINTGSIKDADFLREAEQKIADAKREMESFMPLLDACSLG